MALCELGCPSLDYVYRMTWAEFRIRLHAFKRNEKRAWYHTREICYQIYVSNWLDSKKKPMPKNQYMRLDTEKSGVLSKAQIDRIEQVKKEYLNQVNNGG